MKKINLNKSTDLQKLQESINTILEARISNAKREEIIESFNKLPLGSLCDIFSSVVEKIFESADGKKAIAKYVKTVRENADLRNAFSIYHITSSPKHVNNVPLFISETLSICGDINKKTLNEGKKELSKVVAEAVRVAGLSREEIENAISENKTVNEAIEYLAGNKKTAKNIYEYVKSVEAITEHVANVLPEEDVLEEGQTVKSLSESLASTISESELEPWENETVWDIVSTKLSQGSKSGLFESYKKKCLDVMDTILESQENVAEKSRISAMRTQLESKNYSEDSFTEDIFNLSKLCHTLSE